MIRYHTKLGITLLKAPCHANTSAEAKKEFEFNLLDALYLLCFAWNSVLTPSTDYRKPLVMLIHQQTEAKKEFEFNLLDALYLLHFAWNSVLTPSTVSVWFK